MSLRTTLRIWVFSDAESINLSCLQSPEICHACRVQKSTTLTESKNLSRLQSSEIYQACRVQKFITLAESRNLSRLQSLEIYLTCRFQKSITLAESRNKSRLQSPEICHALQSARSSPTLRAGGDFCPGGFSCSSHFWKKTITVKR